MFWFPSEKTLRDRDVLKDAIAKVKAENGSIEQIKEVFVSTGYDDMFSICGLAGHWIDLMIHLDLTPEEWNKLGLTKWMS